MEPEVAISITYLSPSQCGSQGRGRASFAVVPTIIPRRDLNWPGLDFLPESVEPEIGSRQYAVSVWPYLVRMSLEKGGLPPESDGMESPIKKEGRKEHAKKIEFLGLKILTLASDLKILTLGSN